jgi:hypothetical protein
MVEHICDTCNKKFDRKSTYDYHITRKNPCKPPNIDNAKDTFKCPNCPMIYTRKCNLEKHVLFHQEDNERREFERKEFERCELERKELERKANEKERLYNEMIQKNPNINNNTTQNNVNNLNNLNLQLTPFGKEDLSFITDAECKKILDRGFNAVTALIEYVHFDEKKPELQNCYTSNNRDKYSLTYDGARWNLVETADVIESLREISEGFLDKKFDTLSNKMGIQGARRFKNYLKNKNDKELIQRHKHDIKMFLYNNREMVKKNRDLYDKQQKLLKQ